MQDTDRRIKESDRARPLISTSDLASLKTTKENVMRRSVSSITYAKIINKDEIGGVHGLYCTVWTIKNVTNFVPWKDNPSGVSP